MLYESPTEHYDKCDGTYDIENQCWCDYYDEFYYIYEDDKEVV